MRNFITILEAAERQNSLDIALGSFTKLAWDFDETLIDNVNAELFAEYILSHQEQEHYIVTFRTHGYQHQVWSHLRAVGSPLVQLHFDGMFNISDQAWMANEEARQARRDGLLSGPLTDAEIYYREWKGMVCRKHGLQVLIDDNIENTEPGCIKYNVKLFYSSPHDEIE